MKVGFLQFAPRFGDKEYNLNRALELLSGTTAELLVLPELFTSGYFFSDKAELEQLAEEIPNGESTQALIKLANEKNIYLVAGLAEKADGVFYNSAVTVGPEGFIGNYRKIHLFYEENLFFTPGNLPFPVYDLGKAKIGVMICYDWFFPEAARTLALQGAEVICHPTNLVLPYCPDVMPTRCLENRVYAVTSDRVGKDAHGERSLSFIGMSQVVDPWGKILLRAGETEEIVGEVEIEPQKASDKTLNEHNHLFNNRRPEFYQPMCRK